MKYEIIIPAYNEAERIGATLDSILEVFPEASITVVDDGSKDATAVIAEEKGVKVLVHNMNLGKGAAVKTGFLSAQAEVIGFIDADGSTNPNDVRRIFELVGGYDIVIGSRRMQESVIPKDQSSTRKIAGILLRNLVNFFLGLGICDTQCGCKAFRGKIGKEIGKNIRSKGFVFDIEMLYLGKKMGCNILEEPVEWVNDERTRVNIFLDGILMGFGVIKIKIWDLLGRF